jgi:omega-6 fatty acid desaturase (delta-12 desaturase)
LQKYVAAGEFTPAGTGDARHEARVRKLAAQRFAAHCARFKGANVRQAAVQTGTTLGLLLGTLAVMVWTSSFAPWLALLLAVPAGCFLVRTFIIQHDCGHGSFLPSRAANDILGRAVSILTVTPYGLWRREHAMHHAGSGNLDRRGVGDIQTLTVAEYARKPWYAQLAYRTYRHPLFLFGFGVPFYFTVIQRLPWFHGLPARDAWKSVMSLNAAIVLVYGSIGYLVGFGTLAFVMLPVVCVSSAIGGWLFFIQHQFEETHWDGQESWDFQVAAIYGSSYYALPKWLDWLTGSIGVHHIHHLNSMIPNYRLQACLAAMPELCEVNRMTLRESLGTVRLTLWDEKSRRLVGFADARRMLNQPA